MPTDEKQPKPVRTYWSQATVARAAGRPFDEIIVTMTDEGGGAFLVLTGRDMETGLRVDLDELEVVLVVARQMLAQEEANDGN